MTSNGPYNIPIISSKSKAFSYRDIISTGGCPPSGIGASEFQAASSYNSIFSDSELPVSHSTCSSASWAEFFVPVNTQPFFDSEIHPASRTMSRQALEVAPIDSTGMPSSEDDVNDMGSVFQLPPDAPDDLGIWPPSSPIAGSGSRAARMASPPPLMGPTSGDADEDGAVQLGAAGGGAAAAQEAADALVEFVRQHPELRGSLWSRLRDGFEGCL